MSHTTLPATVVRDACQAYLARREAAIAREREPLIQAAMQPLRVGPFTLRKARTREEAIAALDKGSAIASEWHLAKWRGGYWAAEAKHLLKMAETAIEIANGDDATVTLSAEDVELIF